MINGRKIIGVCLAKVQDSFNKYFLKHLSDTVDTDEYKIIVFNSVLDLYNNDAYDRGSKSIFDIMNYDMLDAVIIVCQQFYGADVIEDIIAKSKARDIPVVLIHGERDDCFSIKTDYKESYKKLIRHVIKDHNVRDPFFIAGRCSDDDFDSFIRIDCFKDILKENGIEFSAGMVKCGEYWDIPTRSIIKDLISSGRKLPGAIICANDIMAVAACEELEENGYRVPADVIVTGFDGVPETQHYVPRLTTCRENMAGLAETALEIIRKAETSGERSGVYYNEYEPYIAESCGCTDPSGLNDRDREREIYKEMQLVLSHEGHIFTWIDRILECNDVTRLSATMRDYILANSGVCLRSDILASAISNIDGFDKSKLPEELVLISSRNRDYTSGKQVRFRTADMIPDLDEWIEDKTMYILSAIFVQEDVCGYYAVKSDDVLTSAGQLNRVSKMMNIALMSVISRAAKENIQKTVQKAAYTDTLTGMPNLKGVGKWFEDFSKIPENHEKTLAVSVYSIPQYRFIFENYGIQDIEDAIKLVGEALTLANSENGYVAHIADDEFVVINYVDDGSAIGDIINNSVAIFFGVIEGYNNNNGRDYYVEVNCGCTVVNKGWNSDIKTFIKLANAEMYVNRLKAGSGPVLKDEKAAKPNYGKAPKDLYNEFNILIERNLFTYFFQPIVDAKTGEIYAYEALMRTTGIVKMSPLEVLDVAKEYNKLYEIERATMFNVLERYVRDNDKFGNRKVFINSIPGSFLNETDLALFKEKYGSYVKNFVFEITEQDTVSDEELDLIRSAGGYGEGSGQIAVDDYGTGHSNIVNLLRYAPQVIKIDRFLISNIEKDANKQMFVKSTIDFAKMNGIKVLAEGVETYEEMKTVIDFGVDLIQGYYTARPAENIAQAIPENIRDEIVGENIALSRLDNDLMTYTASEGEEIDLYDLVLKKYAYVNVAVNNVKFISSIKDYSVMITIKLADNIDVSITFDGINIKGNLETTVVLGENCNAEITLIGDNKLCKEGIYVPDTSSLVIKGDGNLAIEGDRNYGTCIGANYGASYGNITLDIGGKMTLDCSGDKVVGIGGKAPGESCAIKFVRGEYDISLRGISAIGIGSVCGDTNIEVSDEAKVKVQCNANEAVSIGSVSGNINLNSRGEIDALADGERTTAIGTIKGGAGIINLLDGATKAVVHSNKGTCIGSIDGGVDVNCSAALVKVYGEGGTATAIGSMEGSSTTVILSGTVDIGVLSGNAKWFGSEDCKTVIVGGNIQTGKQFGFDFVNAFGDKLHEEIKDSDTFEKMVSTPNGNYLYKAERIEGYKDICVYLPD